MREQERQQRNEWVRQQRLNGKSMGEIAKDLRMTEGGVRYICKNVGCLGKMVDRDAERRHQLRASKASADKLRKTTDLLNAELRPFGFEYVSGYTGCDSRVRIRCLTCGSEIERYYNFTRKKANTACPECERRDVERRRDAKKLAAVRDRELRVIDASKQMELRLASCELCGRLFLPGDRYKYCSAECFHKATNRKKDRRLNSQNIIDKDITLEKLYTRDAGVCYICGQTCDWQDFIVADGITICGDNYPSIEHVTPISRGGLHSWNNVKLACRRCNSIKWARPLPKI